MAVVAQPDNANDNSDPVSENHTPLKIALITTFYPPYNFGGDGNYVRMFAHALARAGQRVDIIHDTDAYRILSNGPEPDPLAEPEGIRLFPLRSQWPKLTCLVTQQTSHPIVHRRTIQKLLQQGEYDVIHYHNVSLVGGLGVLAYGSAVKLYTAHEHWLVCPTHVLWQHNRQVCEKRECIRCQINYKRPIQLWRWSNLLNKKADHVDTFCALSQFSAEQHKKFGFPKEMKILPSFIPDQFDQATDSKTTSTEKLNAPPYYLFVGRIEKIKGLQEVIPLFDASVDAELWIVGSGNYEAELRRIAAGNNKIKFLGRKQPHELKSLYANTLALLTTSICYEVFPLVLLEAFREGTPVIARKLGPYPEIVQQSGAGLLFDNSHELQKAMIDLAQDPQLRQKMSTAGLQAFRKYWSENIALAHYFQLISDIADDKNLEHTHEAAQHALRALQNVTSQV